MDRDRYLTTLRRDIAALLVALRDAGPAAAVPSCPGWTAADLAAHMADVWEWWAIIVRDRVDDPRQVVQTESPPAFEQRLALAERWGAELDRVLTTTDPATPHWTWGSDKTAAFAVRRMAQETAVHRLDAERAAGRSYAIEPELASDGIDEFLFEFLRWAGLADRPLDGSVHVHCTDVAGEWLVQPDGAVTREHAKGDAALRGTRRRPAARAVASRSPRPRRRRRRPGGGRALRRPHQPVRLNCPSDPARSGRNRRTERSTSCAGGPPRPGGRPPCARSARPVPESGGCSRSGCGR